MSLLVSEVVNATIGESSGGKSAPPREVGVTGIFLSDYHVAVAVGDEIPYSVGFIPSNATNQSYTVHDDSDGELILVGENGRLVAKAIGTTTLTFTSMDGGYETVLVVEIKSELIYIDTLTINEPAKDMHVSDVYQLTATYSPEDADVTDLIWSTSDSTVATVSQDGEVIARSLGNVIITVSALTATSDETVEATLDLVVKRPDVSVTGVEIEADKTSMLSNETATVTVHVKPITATDKTYLLIATPVGKVSVNQSTGVVTPSADFDGTATITARTTDGSFTDSVDIVVTAYVAVTGVDFQETDKKVDIAVLTTHDAQVEITPTDASHQGLTFSSADDSIASVDSSTGTITANKKGSVDITVASVDDPTVTDTLAVTVVTNPELISDYAPSSNVLTVSGADNDYVIDGANDDGTVYTVNLSVVPSTGTWGSPTAVIQSGDDIITTPIMDEDNQRFTFTGIDEGQAVVRLHSGIAGVDEVITLITINVTHGIVNVTGVEITDGDSVDVDLSSGTKQLTAVVSPVGATDKSVAWTTSDNTVATVSASGLVTVKKGGSATLTVTTTDGGFTDNILVNVNDDVNVPLTGITLAESPMTNVDWSGSNVTHAMQMAYVPPNTTELGVTWSSSDETVMTVSATGVVTVLKLGSSLITVTSTVHNTIKATATMVAVDKRTVSITTPTISDKTYYEGGSYQLTLIKDPADGIVTGAWDTTDHAVATIDANGLLTCLAAGDFGISYAGTDGSGAAVSDSSGGGSVDAADSIDIATPSMRNLPEGTTVAIPYTLTPADVLTTDANVKLVPTTTDETIMSVDSENVTATGVLSSSTQVRMGVKVMVGAVEGNSDSSGMYVSDALVGLTSVPASGSTGATYTEGTAVDGKNQATLTFASLAASSAAGYTLNLLPDPASSAIFSFTVNSADVTKCTAVDSSAATNTVPPTIVIKPVVVDTSGTVVTVDAHGKVLEIKVITSAA